jgi:hypothetical protein
VIVEVVLPSAGTDVGDAATVDFAADTGPAVTVTLGEPESSAAGVPPDVEVCETGKLAVPAVDCAVAPGPPPPVAPYVMVTGCPPAGERPLTVMTRPATVGVPADDVV